MKINIKYVFFVVFAIFALNLTSAYGQGSERTIWDPFNPVIYFLHTVLGTAGVVSAIVALTALKGSSAHVRGGWIFTILVLVAAMTAIGFSFTAFAPLSIATSLIVAGLVLSSILALRERTKGVKIGERVAFSLLAFPCFVLFAQAVLLLGTVTGLIPMPPPPPGVEVPPMSFMAMFGVINGGYALIVLLFLIGDFRFFRLDSIARSKNRFRRHLSRMAFALAIAVHAPVVSFGDDLGLNPVLAFFGPFIIWPIIMFIFRNHGLLKPTDNLNQSPAKSLFRGAKL